MKWELEDSLVILGFGLFTWGLLRLSLTLTLLVWGLVLLWMGVGKKWVARKTPEREEAS